MTAHSHSVVVIFTLQKMAEYNPNLPLDPIDEKQNFSAPATPSEPPFEPSLEEQEVPDSKPFSIVSLQCPLLIFFVLCLLVVALESVKIARTQVSSTRAVFASIVLVLLMFAFFLLGLWLIYNLCGEFAPLANTAIAIALPFVFWLVTSIATSSALGTTYRLFN